MRRHWQSSGYDVVRGGALPLCSSPHLLPCSGPPTLHSACPTSSHLFDVDSRAPSTSPSTSTAFSTTSPPALNDSTHRSCDSSGSSLLPIDTTVALGQLGSATLPSPLLAAPLWFPAMPRYTWEDVSADLFSSLPSPLCGPSSPVSGSAAFGLCFMLGYLWKEGREEDQVSPCSSLTSSLGPPRTPRPRPLPPLLQS